MPLRQHLRVTQKGDVITYLLISVDVKRLFFSCNADNSSILNHKIRHYTVVSNPRFVGFGFPYGRIMAVLCIFYYSLFLRTTLFSPYIIRLF